MCVQMCACVCVRACVRACVCAYYTTGNHVMGTLKHVLFAFAKKCRICPGEHARTPSYTADLVLLVCVAGTHPHVTASAPGIWTAPAINVPTAASGQIERNIYRRFATRLSVFYRRAHSFIGCCRCCTSLASAVATARRIRDVGTRNTRKTPPTAHARLVRRHIVFMLFCHFLS